MTARFIIAIATAGMALAGCRGTGKVGMMPPAPAKWQAPAVTVAETAEQVEQIIDGEAHQYLQYGLVSLAHGLYKGPAGATATVDFYKMPSANEAFGVYSIWREGKTVEPIGTEGFREGGDVNFYKGRYFVRVKVEDYPGSDIGELAGKLAEQAADKLQDAPLTIPHLALLPKENQLANTVRYIKKDFRGQEAFSEAVCAKYKSDKISYECFISDRKTPAAAANAFEHLKDSLATALGKPVTASVVDGMPAISYDDEFEGAATIIQAGRFIVGANAGQAQVAKSLAQHVGKLP